MFSIKTLSLLRATDPPSVVPILDLDASRIWLYFILSWRKTFRCWGVRMFELKFNFVWRDSYNAMWVAVKRNILKPASTATLWTDLPLSYPPWYSHMHIILTTLLLVLGRGIVYLGMLCYASSWTCYHKFIVLVLFCLVGYLFN